MEDDVGAGVAEQLVHRRGVGDARLVQHRAGGEGAVEVLALTGGEVVDDAHAPTFREQGVDEVGADEAGPAGHERVHRATAYGRAPS